MRATARHTCSAMAMQIADTVLKAHECTITCVAFDQARSIVFVGAEHTDIRAWSLKAPGGAPVATMKAHKGHLSSLAYCDGLNVLISGGLDGLCVLWDERFKVLQVRQRKPSLTTADCDNA